MRKDTVCVLLLLLLVGLLAGEAPESYAAKGASLESASKQKSQEVVIDRPENSKETFKNDGDDDLYYIPSYDQVPDPQQVEAASMQQEQDGIDVDGDEEARGYTGGLVAHGLKRDKRFFSSAWNGIKNTAKKVTDGTKKAIRAPIRYAALTNSALSTIQERPWGRR